MIYIAALLFGMVHPGSKLLLGSGLDLSSFCLLYLGFRFVFQGLLLWRAGRQPQITRAAWGWLLALGAVGAGLQFAEFFGISKGLPVPIVTFLVYTHPVWSLGLNRVFNHEKITVRNFIFMCVGLVGIALVVGSAWKMPAGNSVWPLVTSLIAGLLIALWVSLAHRARIEGVSSASVAFYYDGFAFGALLLLRLLGTGEMAAELSGSGVLAWLASPLHLSMILVYATAVGVLPNMLFYQGQLKIGARAAGLVLLLEPVVSSLISHWIWNDQLSETFMLGSILILAAAVPPQTFTWLRARGLKRASAAVLLVWILGGGGGVARASSVPRVAVGDSPSTHGMLIFGSSQIYLSHLPMFHRPHDYQVLMEVQLDPRSQATFIADEALHQNDGTFYTLVPETFVLPTVVQEMRGFHGTLYRGHFERGGTVLVESVSISISSVLNFQKFAPNASRPQAWTGYIFGSGDDAWIAHKITARPDFDQIIHVHRAASATEFLAFTLKASDTEALSASSELDLSEPDGGEKVREVRELYLETGDLE